MTLEAFAELAGVDPADIEAYRSAGLLDPDGDGCFDDHDVLRLRLVLLYRDLGRSVEEIVAAVREGGVLGDRQLGELLFGSGRRLAAAEAAAAAGLGAEQIEELRRATGLAGTPLAEGDLAVFRAVRRLLDAGLPWEAVVEAARVYGDTLRRLAYAEVRLAHDHLHEPLERSGAPAAEVAERVIALGELARTLADPLILYLHQQFLLRAAVEDAFAHLESEAGRGGAGEATVVFVDLASFTALAAAHGDLSAAQVLDRFDALVRSLSYEHGGTVVKQIGDGFMLTFRDPADAVRFAAALDAAAAAERHFPALRVGINSGPVLHRVGDLVGLTVNVASRLAGLARPGEVLMTEVVAQAARGAGLGVEQAGRREVRGLDRPLELWRLGRAPRRRERDPVCGMLVGDEPAGRLVAGGFEFAFCSQDCLRRFLEDPSRYAPAS